MSVCDIALILFYKFTLNDGDKNKQAQRTTTILFVVVVVVFVVFVGGGMVYQ